MRLARHYLPRILKRTHAGASSGSVVAARLSAHPDVRVLLLEASPTDDAATVDDPLRWPENLGSERDWQRCGPCGHARDLPRARSPVLAPSCPELPGAARSCPELPGAAKRIWHVRGTTIK